MLQDVSERKVRFTSTLLPKELLERIENTVTHMGFKVEKRNGKIGTNYDDIVMCTFTVYN